MLRHPLTCLAAIPLSLLFSLGILIASLEADPVPPLIIHAAGRVDGISGTNSLEALEETYAAGGRAIEIDFDWTSDGELVCIHDFTDRFTPLLHGEPCTLEEFLNIRYLNRYTPMTARDLLDWLSRHTDVILITDFKSGNVDGLETLAWMAQDYPNLQSRIYPQIYHQEEYWPVRGAGLPEYYLHPVRRALRHPQGCGGDHRLCPEPPAGRRYGSHGHCGPTGAELCGYHQ